MELTQQQIKTINALQNNPDWIEIINNIFEVVSSERSYEHNNFEWYEVHAKPAILKNMVYANILNIAYASNKTTAYELSDAEDLKICLKNISKDVNMVTEIPENLFDDIVLQDDLKMILKRSIHSKRPVHVLMIGKPATSKTMFLSNLSKLPSSKYILGSTMSRAGLVDYLIESHPRYLVIDELDKMLGKDYATLLSLMETGIVTRLKHGMREQTKMTTWVFAGVNSTHRIPQEILSRFFQCNVSEYTKEDFYTIAGNLLDREETFDIELRQNITEYTYSTTKDVRDIIKYARLCDNFNDFQNIVKSQL